MTKAIDANGRLIWIPTIDGLRVLEPVGGRVTQAFGVVSVTGILHRGRDKSVPELTPGVVPKDGTVTFTVTDSWSHYGPIPVDYKGVDTRNGGYGNQVRIDHGNGITSRHGHLKTVAVTVGQRVQAGDVFGLTGSTGISTGPHLHWELRQWDMPFDPAEYIVDALEEDLDEAQTTAIAKREAQAAAADAVSLAKAETQRLLAEANTKHYADTHQYLAKWANWGKQPKLMDLVGNFWNRLSRFAPGWPMQPPTQAEPPPNPTIEQGLEP